ncbi:Na+/H+ antiporter NhaA [Aestuariibacter sp. AA17]|uniref:Na(+)/H(+) antiporter NhaA n=1 Tax=Fluctibacter corallii TaxID=2984329 RepID=A0ABT3A4R7_9ALTE|nr:Na+/H+ antiporter NhaA [Aestuariibacter sp. AA17]MCV2883237.1 Na+/H+ antiporter NhaA [Aestuariibacter sp. AA17]
MKILISQLVKHEGFGGALLVFAALVAMVIANSSWSLGYLNTLDIPVVFRFGAFEIAKPLLLWINDGLMAVFFFLIGLEVKREMREGQLSSKEQIVLPFIAAVAGVAVPALVYAWLNADNPVAIAGWAVPSATDIAFALGIFALFSKQLPLSLKLFLLSVAIFDDIAAIVIIALFYSQDLSIVSLMIAATGFVVLFTLNRLRVKHVSFYIIVTIVIWAAVLKSGVHATLAGFLAALFIPINVKNSYDQRLLSKMEHDLHPWVAFFILPVFAFANAGVSLEGVTLESLAHPVTLGIIAGLFLGKQIGIFSACWIAIKLGLSRLPKDSTWMQLYGVSLLCGVGFTMSLFIGSLAFETQGIEYIANVKLGVLVASLLSAFAGAILLKLSCRNLPAQA